MSFMNPSLADVRRRRLLVGGASVLITAIVMAGFLVESRSGYSKPDEKIVFMQSWRADRSRADSIADTRATSAAQAASLAQSRAYIATLTGKPRADAQKQYDAYVKGDGATHDIPYVSAAATEPPVL